MRRTALLLIPVLLMSLLAACSSGPRKRIFAPTASIQELVVQPDGQWQVRVRIQSFSNVPHTVSELSARLRIDGIDAAAITFSPAVSIGPQSAEVEDLTLSPAAEATARVNAALASGRRVEYALSGTLVSSDPDRRRDEFTFEGQLWPVPGLPGVLR